MSCSAEISLKKSFITSGLGPIINTQYQNLPFLEHIYMRAINPLGPMEFFIK